MELPAQLVHKLIKYPRNIIRRNRIKGQIKRQTQRISQVILTAANTVLWLIPVANAQPTNQICKGCGTKNHFKAVCKAKHVKQIVAESSCDSESDDEVEFFVGSITSCTTGDDTFDVTASLKQLQILSEEIAEYQNELENMDTLNKVNPGDIRTGGPFTEVYNDKGESVSGEKNERSDGNLSNDNNLSSQSSDSDSDDIEEYFIDAVDFVENDSTHEDRITTLKTCG